MKVFGIIAYVNLEKRLIGLTDKKNRIYYYFPSRLMKLFKRYLYEGNVITFICDNDSVLRNGFYAREIQIVLRIFVPGRFKNDVFFDKSQITKSMLEFLSSLGNMMFLDLEMTMGRYYGSNNLAGEIIQAAFILVKENLIIEKKKYLVKPTRTKYFNAMTKEFLGMKNNDYRNAISYYDFFNDFKKYIKKYQPNIIVWGKNDITALNNSYIINRVNPATKQMRFVDLNSLIKSYYGLSQDPGLFKLYQQYNEDFEKTQVHDPLEDAFITYQIYNYFMKDLKAGKFTIK